MLIQACLGIYPQKYNVQGLSDYMTLLVCKFYTSLNICDAQCMINFVTTLLILATESSATHRVPNGSLCTVKATKLPRLLIKFPGGTGLSRKPAKAHHLTSLLPPPLFYSTRDELQGFGTALGQSWAILFCTVMIGCWDNDFIKQSTWI